MNDWITIKTFTLPSDAYLAQSLLESQGIETMLGDELMLQESIYANDIGGIKLQVREFEYGHGLQVLKKGGYTPDENPEFEQQIEELFENNLSDKTVCPFCGSKNIGKKNRTEYNHRYYLRCSGRFFSPFQKDKCMFQLRERMEIHPQVEFAGKIIHFLYRNDRINLRLICLLVN